MAILQLELKKPKKNVLVLEEPVEAGFEIPELTFTQSEYETPSLQTGIRSTEKPPETIVPDAPVTADPSMPTPTGTPLGVESPYPENLMETVKGVTHGFANFGSSGVYLAGLIADQLGYTKFADKALSKGLETEKLMQRLLAEVPSIRDIDSLSDFGKWAAFTAGEQAPYMAATIGAGATVGKIGGKIAGNIAGEIGVPAGRAIGAALGAGTVATAIETGGTYGEISQVPGGRTAKGKGLATAAGIISGALEVLPGMRILNKLGFFKRVTNKVASKLLKDATWKRFAKNAITQGAIEAGQETAQEAVQITAKYIADNEQELLGPGFMKELEMRLPEAASKGGFMGFLAGGATTPAQATQAREVVGDEPIPMPEAFGKKDLIEAGNVFEPLEQPAEKPPVEEPPKYQSQKETDYIAAEEIVPFHELVTKKGYKESPFFGPVAADRKKLASLVRSFRARTYSGPPVLLLNDQAITGTHRILAAKKSGVDVPVYQIKTDSAEHEIIMEEINNTDHYEDIPDVFRKHGYDDAASIMEYEANALFAKPVLEQPAEQAPRPVAPTPLIQPKPTEVPDLNLAEGEDVIDTVLDTWHAERDEAAMEIDINTARIQNNIKQAVGEKSKNSRISKGADEALHLYIDLKGKAENQSGKFGEDMSDEQRALYEYSQNLSPELKAVGDQIIALNDAAGQIAVDENVIPDAHENYTMRLWEQEKDIRKQSRLPKFGTRTARSKARTLESILEGWSKGKELQIKGASTAYQVARRQVAQAIADRHLIKLGTEAGVLSHIQQEGWKQIEHPNFRKWKYAGDLEVEEGEIYSNNFILSRSARSPKHRTALEWVPLFAPKPMAKKINNALGKSVFDDPFSKWVTKWNQIIKETVLTTALFHPQAYLRSFFMGAPTKMKNLTFKQSWRAGKKAIENFTPQLRELVRGGLTLGRVQEWDEAARQKQTTLVGKWADKYGATAVMKDKILQLRDWQREFVFQKMGPYYKAQAALLEYQHLVKKNQKKLEEGKITRKEIARQTADLMNDDFGGLHLERMGRSPTRQHIFRLLALAPDWTESNVRSMVKAFKRGNEGAVYREFWARILTRGLTATVVANFMLAAADDDDFIERYRKAWETGNLRWLEVDITPIYRALGGKSQRQKYFSILGHFRDPLKFVSHPIKSAKHKGSIVGTALLEAAIGTDWRGRRFTDWTELLKTGRVVGKGYAGVQALGYGQIPSFLLYRLRAAQPIPVQQLLAFLAGEAEAFDAITKSLGFMTSTTFESNKSKRKFRRTSP